MRKVILYIAMSLDGKIAKVDGDVSWLENLPNPDKTDYGFADFYKTVDTTLMGRITYEQVLGFDVDRPHGGKKNFVFTRSKPEANSDYEFIKKDVAEFVKSLKKEPGSNIWLIGGAQINTALFNAGLIDQMMIFVMPIVLGEGIDLFAARPNQNMLHLIETKTYASGATLLHYEFKK